MGTATLARRNRSETDVAIEKVREAREKSTTPVDRTCNRIHHEIYMWLIPICTNGWLSWK